jgi:hypothetical protein
VLRFEAQEGAKQPTMAKGTHVAEISPDLMKIGIEDARARHGAIVNLILSLDAQAMGLLRLYVPVAIAAGTAAIAAFSPGSSIPKPVGAALAMIALALIVASWFCFKVMRSEKINLPGRGPDFWIRAPEFEISEMYQAYMTELVRHQRDNNDLNKASADHLKWAKVFAILSPGLGLVIGGAAIVFGV